VSVLFLVLLPLSAGFQDSIAASLPPTFRTAEGLLRVPGLGLLALLGSAPFLLIRNRHESPRLGPLLGLAVLFFFAALNLQSSMWRPAQQTALLLFASAGGLVLAGAALESAWHHMNMDELTELPGRRPLKHHLRCLAGSYALAVVDLDHFKQVNDTHGHLVGDQVLRYLARLLVSQATGTVYRYGGEEFVIVYDRREFDAVLADLEEVRAAVEDKAFAIRGRDRPTRKPRRRKPGPARNVRTIRLTVSIGAARSGPRYAGAQDVLDAADRALYEAKTSGRNRVCAAS
jgi:diguanylate cyclase (GGDEF)-like protein